MNKGITKRLLGYFLNGLLLVVPVFIIVYVVFWLFRQLNSLIKIDWFPGSGIVVLFLLIGLVGYLGSTFIGKPIRKWINGLLDRVPLLKTLYTAINDLLSAFVGKKKRFDKPVLVKVNENSNLEKLGFVTDEDLSDLGIDDQNKIAVYLPHSYNFSGNLFIVTKAQITPIDKKASEVMKYIVSGGVIDVKEDE